MASDLPKTKAPIQSTAGAIPFKNEKGEISMQKVKVSRYVTGKRPEWQAQESSEEEEEEDFIQARRDRLLQDGDDDDDAEGEDRGKAVEDEPMAASDRRLRRLQQMRAMADEEDEDERLVRHRRRVQEPEVIMDGSDMEEEASAEGSESEEEVDEEEIERRRTQMRERARVRQQEDLMEVQEEEERADDDGVPGGDSSSEYEAYTDSEEEEMEPRFKPVFVRKRDRVTIQEKERQLIKEKELEMDAKRMAEERKAQARKLVEQVAKQQFEETRETKDSCENIDTDEENDEEEYEAWKVRELKRVKRDKELRDTTEKEKAEIDRFRNLTEDEKKAELRANPKLVTNKSTKGKYKFLQKYYHRGAFFLDKEDTVFKRDITAPTLEDHYDKTILPKVMQVKNFGRSGRTKYTHLVDQDTTEFESPWTTDTAQNLNFQRNRGGGMKQVFEKPVIRKKKL